MGLFWKKKTQVSSIYSPTNGELNDLNSLNDGVFSEKMLGNGFVVSQTDGMVYAPISGELVTVFPTKHAYGIKSKDGINVLVHIGIDTVNLNGEGFETKLSQGGFVKQGDLLAKVDLELLKEKNLKSDVVVVVTSESSHQPDEKAIKTNGKVTTSDVVIDKYTK